LHRIIARNTTASDWVRAVLPPRQNLPADQRTLLKIYSGLEAEARTTLMVFAEFLADRQSAAETAGNLPVTEPEPIPRPDEETVIGAIKRLSASYHMLDRSALLTETSSLMTAHIVHGREAGEVIDELESMFARHYQQLNTDQD